MLGTLLTLFWSYSNNWFHRNGQGDATNENMIKQKKPPSFPYCQIEHVKKRAELGNCNSVIPNPGCSKRGPQLWPDSQAELQKEFECHPEDLT